MSWSTINSFQFSESNQNIEKELLRISKNANTLEKSEIFLSNSQILISLADRLRKPPLSAVCLQIRITKKLNISYIINYSMLVKSAKRKLVNDSAHEY